jgi:hypothetical protein
MQSLTRKQDEEIRLAGHAHPSQFELNGTRNNVFLTYGAAAAVENPRLKNQDVNDAMRRFQKRPVAHGPTAHVEVPSLATGDRDLAAVKRVDAYDPNTTTHTPTSLNAVVARGTRSATRAKIHKLGRGTMLAVGALGARSGDKRSYSDLNPPPPPNGQPLEDGHSEDRLTSRTLAPFSTTDMAVTNATDPIACEGHHQQRKKARSGPKAEEEQALRTVIGRKPTAEMISRRIGANLFDRLLDICNIGRKFEGSGLKKFLFEPGPMTDFCATIARFNSTECKDVKKSKMKMLKTWQNDNNQFFDYDPASAKSIRLTVRGKHDLLMHIDTEENGMSHDMENLFRNELSTHLQDVFELSDDLPRHFMTASDNYETKKARHEDGKVQLRRQRQLMVNHGQAENDMKAMRKLQGATPILSRGLYPKKPSGKTYSAVEMVLMANPGKNRKQIYSRTVIAHANEPVLHAMLLQRTAVTFRMSQGEDYLKAHASVADSGGIDLMALCGLDKNDPASIQKLADLSYNKVAGIEHFGQQQLMAPPAPPGQFLVQA